MRFFFLSDGSESYGFEGDNELMMLHLRAEITSLVRESEGVFDVAFLLSELEDKYPNLTEEDILEVYGRSDLFSLEHYGSFKLVSGGRSDVIGGEGGN